MFHILNAWSLLLVNSCRCVWAARRCREEREADLCCGGGAMSQSKSSRHNDKVVAKLRITEGLSTDVVYESLLKDCALKLRHVSTYA